MTKRTKLFILAIIALIILIIILLLINFNKPGDDNQAQPPDTNQANEPPLPGIKIPEVIEPAPAEPQEQNPAVMAADFAERYGSYSNQGEYQNLHDLFSQMTAVMKRRTESLIASNPLEAGDYEGIITKVIRTEVLSKTDSEARVLVDTQRTETTAENPQARVFYQSAELTLVRDDLKWLVDSLTWK